MGKRGAEVKVFTVRKRTDPKTAKVYHRVRWVVRGRNHEANFRYQKQANSFQSELVKAVSNGERFSNETGLPLSMELSQINTAIMCRQWVDSKRSAWEPKTRESNIVPLAEMLVELVTSRAPEPPAGIVKAISLWLMDKGDQPAWLAKYSLPLAECTPARCADAMSVLSHCLDEDGNRTSTLKKPNTVNRYRRACRPFFDFAVRRELLRTNPWPVAPRGKRTRKETSSKAVRVDLLPSAEEAKAAIEAVKSHQPRSVEYQMICAMVFYAGFRPSEARALTIEACDLPDEGWGEASIEAAAKLTGRFAEAGDSSIGPPKTADRTVPLSPVLVEMIRAHIGDRTEGLICRSASGGPVDLSRLDRAWRRARGAKQWRVYDLRHAHATLALGAGMPAAEVARRLGHSVKVLFDIYVGAMPADVSTGNALLDKAFG
jgi:integrase